MDFKDSIGIVGTAGRKEDGLKLSASSFIRMVEIAREEAIKHPAATLVSGGSAWADHVAIRLCLELKRRAAIFIPCPFSGSYADDGSRDFRSNPGGTLNYYHRLFSSRCGFDSLGEMQEAVSSGLAVAEAVPGGLFGRNAKVAEKSETLIAFTFGAGAEPKDGGTRDTWDRHSRLHQSRRRIHIDLELLGNPPKAAGRGRGGGGRRDGRGESHLG